MEGEVGGFVDISGGNIEDRKGMCVIGYEGGGDYIFEGG